MNTALFFVLATNLLITIARATLERDVITYINVFRHLHAAGPVLVDDVIQKAAQNAATTFMKTKNKDQVPTYQYSANFCKYTGSEATLDRACVISWYVSMKYFSWCHPKAEGQALPFVNMIWKASSKAGVGIAKDTDGTYYVVVYIALQDANNVAGNVPPVKVVMEASQKAQCPTGYSRFQTSCFKYDTTAVSWDEAVVRCARENATLASIRNAKEETFVRNLQRNAGSTAETWIGLHDTLYEGRFKWFDGLRFKHGVCVPVHANGGHLENCVAWSIARPEGCWEDRRCNEKIPYTCRIPVEGKSTYRTEILFKKFRWRPNYKNKNSKAYRDLINGIKITFKEIFTRKSGKKKGGFKKVTVKGVRAISFKGRPAGLGIAVSIKFRSFNADPTLRFQKFLRHSEKLLSMNIDKPDKVEGQTGKAGDYCYNACNQKQTCTASFQQHSTYGYYPGFPAPAPQPYSPGVYSYPGSVQSVATTTSDPYPSTCPMSCSQHSTLNCYMQCRDECCENRHGKRKRKPNRVNALKHMKENFGKLNQLIEEVRKQPKDRHGDSINETNRTEEKAEKVIESIETNVKQLGVGFKTKNKVTNQSHLHNMHKATDNRKEHFTIILNDTQNSKPSTFDDEHNNGFNLEKPINSLDLIDDDPETIHSNESSIELQDNPGKNKVISENNQKENGKEIQFHGSELGDERESNSLVNEDTIPQNEEISMREEDEEAMKDNSVHDSDDENTEPGERHSEPEDYDDDDDDDDDDDGDDDDDDDSETNIEDDESDQPGDDFVFRDSLKDPGDDMLDEEGIDDVGKFGKKRDKVLKKKKSSLKS